MVVNHSKDVLSTEEIQGAEHVGTTPPTSTVELKRAATVPDHALVEIRAVSDTCLVIWRDQSEILVDLSQCSQLVRSLEGRTEHMLVSSRMSLPHPLAIVWLVRRPIT